MNTQSFTPRSIACWEAFIISASKMNSLFNYLSVELLSTVWHQWHKPVNLNLQTCYVYKMSSPGRQRQNVVGASFTSMSLQASTNGPMTSTGLGNEHSTFWTRWYIRFPPSGQKTQENNWFQHSAGRQSYKWEYTFWYPFLLLTDWNSNFLLSVKGKESVLMASRAIRSFPSLDTLRLCFSLRRKKDLRAAADRVLLVPLSSFMSAMLCRLQNSWSILRDHMNTIMITLLS